MHIRDVRSHGNFMKHDIFIHAIFCILIRVSYTQCAVLHARYIKLWLLNEFDTYMLYSGIHVV